MTHTTDLSEDSKVRLTPSHNEFRDEFQDIVAHLSCVEVYTSPRLATEVDFVLPLLEHKELV